MSQLLIILGLVVAGYLIYDFICWAIAILIVIKEMYE